MLAAPQKGFTLFELLVSISIFVLMTALLVAKFGNFNQSVLLTNLAYDVALALRTAQTYGLSVQGQSEGSVPVFKYPYGVSFCALDTCAGNSSTDTFTNQQIIMYADSDTAPATINAPSTQGSYDYSVTSNNSDIKLSTYNIKRGAKIVGFCGDVTCTGTTINRVDISFVRPNPNAYICVSYTGEGNPCYTKSIYQNPLRTYIKIIIQGTDGSRRNVVVSKTGQISVEE